MPTILRSTLLCDDVRREDSGKLIIIGVYTPHIVVQSTPAVLSLWTFQVWEADAVSTNRLTILVRHIESRTTVFEGAAHVAIPGSGQGFLAFPFGRLRFDLPGPYEFVVMIDGDDTPAGRHVFSVLVQRVSP